MPINPFHDAPPHEPRFARRVASRRHVRARLGVRRVVRRELAAPHHRGTLLRNLRRSHARPLRLHVAKGREGTPMEPSDCGSRLGTNIHEMLGAAVRTAHSTPNSENRVRRTRRCQWGQIPMKSYVDLVIPRCRLRDGPSSPSAGSSYKMAVGDGVRRRPKQEHLIKLVGRSHGERV